jgi:hypothetical protein
MNWIVLAQDSLYSADGVKPLRFVTADSASIATASTEN